MHPTNDDDQNHTLKQQQNTDTWKVKAHRWRRIFQQAMLSFTHHHVQSVRCLGGMRDCWKQPTGATKKVSDFQRWEEKYRSLVVLRTWCFKLCAYNCVYGVPDTVTLMCERWALSRTNRCATATWNGGLFLSTEDKYKRNTDSLNKWVWEIAMLNGWVRERWLLQFPKWVFEIRLSSASCPLQLLLAPGRRSPLFPSLTAALLPTPVSYTDVHMPHTFSYSRPIIPLAPLNKCTRLSPKAISQPSSSTASKVLFSQ